MDAFHQAARNLHTARRVRATHPTTTEQFEALLVRANPAGDTRLPWIVWTDAGDEIAISTFTELGD